MEGRYHFHSPEWDDISESAKDLVSFRFFEKIILRELCCNINCCNSKLQHHHQEVDYQVETWKHRNTKRD